MSKSSISQASAFSKFSNIGESWKAGKDYYVSKREAIGPLFGYLVIMSVFIVCQVIVMAIMARKLISTSSSFFKELQERNWGELMNKINGTSLQIQSAAIADIPAKELTDIDNQLTQYRKTFDEYRANCTRLIRNLNNDLNASENLSKDIEKESEKMKSVSGKIKILQLNITTVSGEWKVKVANHEVTVNSSNTLKEALSQVFKGDVLFLVPRSDYDWVKKNQKWLVNPVSPINLGYIRIGPSKYHESKLNLNFGINGTQIAPYLRNGSFIHNAEFADTQDPIGSILLNDMKFDHQKFFNNLKAKRLNVLFRTVKFKKIPDP